MACLIRLFRLGRRGRWRGLVGGFQAIEGRWETTYPMAKAKKLRVLMATILMFLGWWYVMMDVKTCVDGSDIWVFYNRVGCWVGISM